MITILVISGRKRRDIPALFRQLSHSRAAGSTASGHDWKIIPPYLTSSPYQLCIPLPLLKILYKILLLSLPFLILSMCIVHVSYAPLEEISLCMRGLFSVWTDEFVFYSSLPSNSWLFSDCRWFLSVTVDRMTKKKRLVWSSDTFVKFYNYFYLSPFVNFEFSLTIVMKFVKSVCCIVDFLLFEWGCSFCSSEVLTELAHGWPSSN